MLVWRVSIVVALLLALAGAVPACSPKPHATGAPSPNRALVQVWKLAGSPTKGGELLGFGVVVGDGTQVLTVIDYEMHAPGELEVVAPGLGRFTAWTEALDSRTGATLLKLKNGRLPAATLADSDSIKPGLRVTIQGWSVPMLTYEERKVEVSSLQGLMPLAFNVNVLHGAVGGWTGDQGAMVTDLKGAVLGLEGIYTYGLNGRLGGMGFVPPIVTIGSAMELLGGNPEQLPWSNGPLLFVAKLKDGGFINVDGFVSNYSAVARAIEDSLHSVGKPLHIDDSPNDLGLRYIWSQTPPDWSVLVTVYPRPVDLRNGAGKVLATAKWVGLQWDRADGKPNRVIYGSSPYTADGSLEMLGDTASLQSQVAEIVERPSGP